MATVTQLPGWNMRVYRVAAKSSETMAQATKFCRDHGVIPYPEFMLKLNPDIKSNRK